MQLRYKQRGALLVSALFLIIVVVAFVTVLSRMLSTSAHSNIIEYYGSLALLTAQSGIEWQLNQLFSSKNGACNSTETPNVTAVTYMSYCSVDVSCQLIEDIDDSNSVTSTLNIYRIASTATCDAGRFSTERTIYVDAKTL